MLQHAGSTRRVGSTPMLPGKRRASCADRDTTFRQVGERLRQSHAMVADGLAEVAVLTDLRAAMTTAHAFTVHTLSVATQARHSGAIRLTAGASGGVEMW